MNRFERILGMLLLVGAMFPHLAVAETQTFTGGPARVTLIELFTSEGCSSCPPADAWISRLKSDPRLWKNLVPVAFHVDYWDYLGWKDRFAHTEHSARQRTHQRQGKVRAVYTPGFVVDGREWRGWFSGRKIPVTGSDGGVLTVRVDGSRIEATLTPAESEDLVLNLALLGFGLKSEIGRGENAGATLLHDFAVLAMEQTSSDSGIWRVDFPAVRNSTERKLALAAWVNRKSDLEPVQATGGWLED